MKLTAFEQMIPKKLYAFTVNIANDGGGSLAQRVCHYIAFFKKYVQHAQYKLYPEISKTGKLHYHGYIWFSTYNDIFLFNLEVMPLFCNEHLADIEIDTIGEKFGDVYWYCYIRKMRHLMHPYMNKNKIMYKLQSWKLGNNVTGFNTPKEQFKQSLDW